MKKSFKTFALVMSLGTPLSHLHPAEPTTPKVVPSSQPNASSASTTSRPPSASGNFGVSTSSGSTPSTSSFSNGTSLLGTGFANLGSATYATAAFLHPALGYSFQYGDGLSSTSGRDEKTSIHQLSPSLTISFAQTGSLSYTPTFTWYSSNSYENSTSHSAIAQFSRTIAEVDLSAYQTYSRTELPLVETARQTAQESWSTDVSANYKLGPRTSINGGLNYSTRDTDLFTDAKTFSGRVGGSRTISSKVSTGASAGMSRSNMSQGSDFYSQSLNGNISYTPSPKISTYLSVGVDFSKFDSDQGSTRAHPIYNGSIQYQIFDPTSLAFSVNRSVDASYFANQYTVNSRYSASLQQRLFQRFSFGANLSWSHSDYVALTSAYLPGGRTDRYWSYSAQLSTQVLQRLAVALTYNGTTVTSTSKIYERDTNVYGFNISWRL